MCQEMCFIMPGLLSFNVSLINPVRWVERKSKIKTAPKEKLFPLMRSIFLEKQVKPNALGLSKMVELLGFASLYP